MTAARSAVPLAMAVAVLAAASAWLAMAQDRAQDSASTAATIAALEAHAAELEQRLQRLRDREQLENLQNAYGYYVDKRWWDAVADLFTDDARYELAQQGVFIGRDRIREVLEVSGPSGLERGVLDNHLQIQPLIHVDAGGTTAHMRLHALIQTGTWGASGSWGEGVYENAYRKEDGVWKIASLHFYVTMYAPYDEGWGKAAMPATAGGVQPGYAPDLPPTEIYGFYPQVYIPPFHYANPVSGRPGTGLEGRL